MVLATPDDIIRASCDASGHCTGGLWEYAGLAGMALSISAVILAFIYVWGTLFRNQQYITYVKQELYEIIVTGIFIVLLYSAIGGMMNVTVGMVMPPTLVPNGVESSTTIYQAAALYFNQLDHDMVGWLNMNYVLNTYIDQVASITPYARPMGVGLVASPMAGLAAPLKQLLYNMSVALSVAFVMNYAQLAVYVFSIHAFLNYYLPLGIFLRSFTPTRRMGGTLIGVAVSFLFVYPALYTVTYAMFYNEESGPLVSFNSMAGNYLQDFVSSDEAGGEDSAYVDFYEDNFTESSSGLIDMMSGGFGLIGRAFSSLIGSTFLMLLMVPMAAISTAFAIGFIMPAFNILIFSQAAKSLSKSFGEEVDISSLTRLI